MVDGIVATDHALVIESALRPVWTLMRIVDLCMHTS
jgi:hypothetical protein